MRLRHLALAAVLAPRLAAGQADSATVADSRLFQRSDLYILAGFTAGTILMFPLDRRLASTVRDSDLVANRTLENASRVFRFMGAPGPILIGAGLYTIGRVARVHRAAELGLHGTEAIVVGLGIADVIKNAAGRKRPYATADTNAHSFAFLRGLHDRTARSFPSGHTTAAFSAAAAVTAETKDWWPQYHRVIGIAMYGGAALVGLSRMYHDQHWASDVVMGAAIGTFAGQKTVRFNHTHTGNRLDRWLLGKGQEAASFRVSSGPSGGVWLLADIPF